MRLTARRRALLAIIVTWPLAYYYVDWGTIVLENVVRVWRAGYVQCNNRVEAVSNACDPQHYSYLAAWAELLGGTALVLAVAYLLARWVLLPVRDVAATVGRFGPNSLGLRLRPDGPRDELRRLGDEIDALLDRLAEGYEAQRRFAASASHELRTPLATQRALIEISLAAPLTDEQLGLLSRQLLSTNERNERLVDGLLTLAETDRGLLTDVPLRLDAVVADVVETLRPSAAERGIELDVMLEPITVHGEQALLERLAANLVGNALKYNERGGRVEVRVTADGRLCVGNTGPVVPPEAVAGLFEPFRRLAGERLDHGGGVGLGLTIARSITAAHRGTITAQARPAGGLDVEVRLRPQP
ncbi:MAG: sensor histidine kinase [Jatrophihabitans sp.]|uniref:sensor histidine kinase n=1 Tax=Jatrophihabitans sp. TaxID=1932789 RepID=UPI003F803BDD